MPETPLARGASRVGPIKLLLVTDEMETGGTQRQISLLARGLERVAFAPEVAYFRHRSFLVDELVAAGVPVHEVPKHGRLDPAFFWKLTQLLRRGRYGLVHAFSFTGELWSALAAQLSGRPPIVSSIRGRYDDYSSTQWALKAWVARRSCRVVANSDAGADLAAERMGYPRRDIRVVRNGIEPPPPATGPDPRSALGLSPKHVVGLFVGRLVAVKNVSSLLRAIAALPPTPQPFVLLVAGDGPLRGELEAQARALRIDNRVRFLGERRDVAALLRAAAFLVLPSLGEGLSNVILEAMAAGRPVLASDVPGNREAIVHAQEGLLYPGGDEAAFTHALTQLITDAALRERLGRRGLERAQREFSLEAMVSAMSAIYRECTGVPARPVWEGSPA